MERDRKLAQVAGQLLHATALAIARDANGERRISGHGMPAVVLHSLAGVVGTLGQNSPAVVADLSRHATLRSHPLVIDEPRLRSLLYVRAGSTYLVAASPEIDVFDVATAEAVGSLLSIADTGGAVCPVDDTSSEQLAYKAVFDESLLGILLIDLAGTIVECNPAVREIMGRGCDQLCGRPFLEAVRGSVSGMEWEPFDDLIAGEWDHYQVEKTYTRSGKPNTEARLTVSLVRREDGTPARAVCMVEDISVAKRSERALKEAKERAEAGNLAKSRFLATMSHELRTPLNSVIGFTNVLLKNREENLSESQMKYLKRVVDNGTHLLELINDILDLSKIEADRVSLEMEDVDLGELIGETLAQLEGRVLGGSLELAAKIPAGLPLIRTDPGKLKQILINLVGNALKFTESGHVHVILHAADGRPVRIDVEDTGIGIPEERLGAIFQAFEQADGTTTTRKYGGTGLGLAISSKLAALLGYRVTVASEVGSGSTFSIHLESSKS